MKVKSLLSLLLALVLAFASVPFAYAETGEATLKEVTSLTNSTRSYVATDIEGSSVLTVGYDYTTDTDKCFLTLIDAETGSVTLSKSYKYKSFPLENLDECEINSDGTYTVYDRYNGKSAVYDENLKLKSTGKCSKENYNYESKWSNHTLIETDFVKEKDYAYAYYKSDFTNPIYAIAFPEETSTICFTDAEVDCINDCCGKSFLISNDVSDGQKAMTSVYDFNSKTYVKTETRAFTGYDFYSVSYGYLNEVYAFFVVESNDNTGSYYTPFVWKYSDETEKTAFTVNKVNSKQIKNLYSKYVTELKNTYGINVIINKAPNTYPTYWDDDLGEEYGGVLTGATPVGIYRVLNDLSGYLSYFPKGFTREMAVFGGKTHRFDIYIDREIIGDAAAFANRYDGFLICFATEEFTSAFIPHEFLHLIDARIDDYLYKNGKYYEEEWDRLNPKDFFYYEEQPYNEKFFITSYAMTDPREDRADTFEYLFEGYYNQTHPFINNAVRKKSIYLANLIREVYPSVSKLDFASWEHWITPYPVKVKSKNTETSIKVIWSVCRTATTYELQQKKGSSWKTIYKGPKTKYKLNNLSSGKAFSFRVRALRFDGKRKVYSSWEYYYTATKPKAVKTLKLSTNSSHQIIAKWSKVKPCDGYQIQYARDKSFKNIIAKKYLSSKNKTYKGKNFTKGRKYYIRIRAYTMNGEKTVYSSWSKVKAIKSK